MKRFLYSIMLPFALLTQVLISLFHKDNQRLWVAKIIFYIKKEYQKNNLILLGYSLFPFLLISIAYFICDVVDILPCRFWTGDTFYPFVLAIGTLVITMIIAININPKKIENGEQFIKCLIEHIFYLKYIKDKKQTSEKLKLYLITPNINMGAGIGVDKNFSKIIKEHKCIEFHFICLSIEKEKITTYNSVNNADKANFFAKANDKNKMLLFLYKRYDTTDAKKLDEIITELDAILSNTNVIIHNCSVNLEEQQISGYLSDFECVFGNYSNINKQEGDVNFRGEVITAEEFIKIIKEQMLQHFIQSEDDATAV